MNRHFYQNQTICQHIFFLLSVSELTGMLDIYQPNLSAFF